MRSNSCKAVSKSMHWLSLSFLQGKKEPCKHLLGFSQLLPLTSPYFTFPPPHTPIKNSCSVSRLILPTNLLARFSVALFQWVSVKQSAGPRTSSVKFKWGPNLFGSSNCGLRQISLHMPHILSKLTSDTSSLYLESLARNSVLNNPCRYVYKYYTSGKVSSSLRPSWKEGLAQCLCNVWILTFHMERELWKSVGLI